MTTETAQKLLPYISAGSGLLAVTMVAIPIMSFLVCAAALFLFPFTTAAFVLVPIIFGTATDPLPESYLWIVLSCAPLFVFSISLFVAFDIDAGNLGAPYIVGIWLNVAAVYVALIALACQYRLRVYKKKNPISKV